MGWDGMGWSGAEKWYFVLRNERELREGPGVIWSISNL